MSLIEHSNYEIQHNYRGELLLVKLIGYVSGAKQNIPPDLDDPRFPLKII